MTKKNRNKIHPETRAKIAFLGTGIMGLPMCGHLLKAGYPVQVWNRSPEKAAPLAELGATLCGSPSEAVAGAKYIISMLSTGPVIDQVLFQADSTGNTVEQRLDEGATVIMMSSIPVETARDQATRLRKINVDYVDAPVSGGDIGAVNARLAILAGGDSESIANVQDLLSVMGRVSHVGPVGCGQLVKLANQTIVGININAVAEAFLLIEAGGGDLAAAHKALIGGFADSAILRHHGERMINRSFKPGATAETQLKDMRTSRELAESLGLDLPVLQLTESLYQGMCQNGREDLDHSGLYLEIADRTKA